MFKHTFLQVRAPTCKRKFAVPSSRTGQVRGVWQDVPVKHTSTTSIIIIT
jgi:hypothetical protein